MRAMNMLLAALCVFLFSLTVPFTRIATLEMPPLLVVSLRLFGAALVCLLFIGSQRWVPPRRIWVPLVLTALSSVLGFSLLTAFALREVPGSHGALALAALPAVTAGYSALRDRINPGWLFWLFALLGTLLSTAYFFTDAVAELYVGDLLLALAVFAATLGYVEGGRLSREFEGEKVMSWAVLLALPVILLLAWLWLPLRSLSHYSAQAWWSVAYLALISQSLAMFLWYRVLARGPMAKVALVQLLQPFFTLLAAVMLLGERVESLTWLLALLVLLCVVGAARTRSIAGAR
jgi:drug/metabolite transporter (DMT)-like permease